MSMLKLMHDSIEALLVIVSPRDSVPSAWAGTLLTGSLIIAAIVQKIKHTITLHHAILIMKCVQTVLTSFNWLIL